MEVALVWLSFCRLVSTLVFHRQAATPVLLRFRPNWYFDPANLHSVIVCVRMSLESVDRFVRTCICAYRIWLVVTLLSTVRIVHTLCCQYESRNLFHPDSGDAAMCCTFQLDSYSNCETQASRHSDYFFVHVVMCHKWIVMLVVELVRCASGRKWKFNRTSKRRCSRWIECNGPLYPKPKTSGCLNLLVSVLDFSWRLTQSLDSNHLVERVIFALDLYQHVMMETYPAD